MAHYNAVLVLFVLLQASSFYLNAQTNLDSGNFNIPGNFARQYKSKDMGDMALSDGIFVLAEEDYKHYLKEAEANGDIFLVADALLKLIETYCAWNKPFEARKEYENFQNKARHLLSSEKSLSDRAAFLESCILIAEKKYPESVEKLEKLRNSVSPTDMLQLEILDKLGIAFVRMEKWAEAEKVYSLLADGANIPNAPSNENARIAKNICAFMKGDIEYLKKIAEARDESPIPASAKIARLLIMIKENRLKDAYAFFNEQKNTISSESRNLWYFAIMELANSLRKAEMYSEAALIFENSRIFSAGLGKEEAEKSCLALIETYTLLGDWDKTVENCEYFKKNFPDSPKIFDILLNLARLYSEKFDVKNVKNMKDNYLALINHEFADLNLRNAATLEAAEKLIDVKDYATADELLNKHLSKFPQGSEKRAYSELLLIQAIYHQNRTSEAIDMLKELLKNKNLDNQIQRKAQYLLALATYKFKDYQATKNIIAPALKDFPHGDELGIELGIILADCENQLGNPEAAVRLYSEYAMLYPEKPRTPELLYKAAKISMDIGHFLDAEKFYDRIIADYPKSEFYELALYGKTQTMIFFGNNEKIESDSPAILENLKGNELFFLTLLAIVDYYVGNNMPDKAISLLDNALANSELISTNESQSPVAGTTDAYLRTNGIGSKSTRSKEREWISRLIYEKATILYKFNKIEDALESLSNIFESFKDSPFLAEAYFLQGDMLSTRNEFEKAISAYRESARTRPESKLADSALARVAECLFALRTEKDKLQEAIAINKKLLANPDIPIDFKEHIQYNLARCEEEADNKDAALLLYHRIITEFKNDYLKNGKLRNPIWLVKAANSAAKIYKERGTPDAYEVARQIYKDLANVLKIEPVEEFKKEIKRLDELLAPK